MSAIEQLKTHNILSIEDNKLINNLEEYVDLDYVRGVLEDYIRSMERRANLTNEFKVNKSRESIVPRTNDSIITFKYKTSAHPLEEVIIRFKLENNGSRITEKHGYSGERSGKYFEMSPDMMDCYIDLSDGSNIEEFINSTAENIAINYVESYNRCK